MISAKGMNWLARGAGREWKAAVHTTTSSMHLQKGSEIHRASLELANSRPGSQGQKFNYLLLKCMQKNQPRHKLELIYECSSEKRADLSV